MSYTMEYTLDDAAEEIQALTINQIHELVTDFNQSLNSIIEELTQKRYDSYCESLLGEYIDNQIKARKEDSYE